jgi:hypothetical protein
LQPLAHLCDVQKQAWEAPKKTNPAFSPSQLKTRLTTIAPEITTALEGSGALPKLTISEIM